MAFAKNIFFIVLFSVVAGCGGGSNSIEDVNRSNEADAQNLKLIERDIAGYWISKNMEGPHYEFFLSALERPFTSAIKTGRVLENGFVTSFFYWDVRTDGVIDLNMVSTSCILRPLNLCQPVGSATVVAQGKSINNAKWSISNYKPGNAVAYQHIENVYSKKGIDVSKLPQGEFFLTRNREFGVNLDRPMRLERNGNNLTARIMYLDQPILLSSELDAENAKIEFVGNDNFAILRTQEFYVKNVGYKDFSVKEWYENVYLFGSVNNEYVISFEKHRKVLSASDIDRSAIEIGDFEAVEKQSISFSQLIHEFISIPLIRPADIFYAGMMADFDGEKVTGAFGNTITFTSDTEGFLSHKDSIRDIKSEARAFTWVQHDNGTIVFTFSNYGQVTLRFIRSVNGGYLGLWTNPNKFKDVYIIGDFFRDDSPALNEYSLPGRYEFAASNAKPNGSFAYEVTFHKDKTVSGEVDGYWFEDANGDIVSFDCVNLFGLRVNNYSECDNAFDDLFTMNFAHIRRIKFMHKDGSNYQSKYDASLYGERFGYSNGVYQTVSFVFRWRRIGDEKDPGTIE